MIKFELEDGSIITPEKDCGCMDSIHTGPHWLYADTLWCARNQSLLQSGTTLGFMGCTREEIARLKEKMRHMKQHRIARIIHEPVPEATAAPTADAVPQP